MSKIICDICGTTYPTSSEACPICGCSNTDASELLGAEVSYEEFAEEPVDAGENTTVVSRKKEIFDFDEVNPDEEYADTNDEEDDYDEPEEEESSHNVFIVILLTVLIVLLLGAAGFIFFRFFSFYDSYQIRTDKALL